MAPKHIPMRTCVACRQTQPKRALVRVVRTPEGQIVIDPTGKRAGRGAYLCRRRSCWELALKRGSLEHALKTTLSEEERAQLRAHMESMPEEAGVETAGQG
ncbi:MAG: RNase P modulator RnpM [Anaerolineae bacterium]|nr:YlxR family protein [Synergistales bacterium]